MDPANNGSSFELQLNRIKLATGLWTQAELAKLLDIRPADISRAKRRGEIPSAWLVVLMVCKNVSPEWVLTGKGPALVSFGSLERCENFEAGEQSNQEEILRRLPTRLLADELVRRIEFKWNGPHMPHMPNMEDE